MKKEKTIFSDNVIYTYSMHNIFDIGVKVICPNPKCQKDAIITGDKEKLIAYLNCCHCGKKAEQSLYFEKFDVHNYCKNCGRYYRVNIEKTYHQKLNIACPYCKHKQLGIVQKHTENSYTFGEVKNGVEPFFSCRLYYFGSFKNKIIWALNKEHLNYLIDYISADIRLKSRYCFDSYQGKKTQSDLMPKFMKSKKNREAIVKMLEKMRAL